MRTKGSCRFEPYYKLEFYDPKIGAWRVIQKSFVSFDAAKQAMPQGKQSRVMRFTESGPEVLP